MINDEKFSIIITGGETPEFDRVEALFNFAEFCVCADSGWDYAKSYGIDVDVVLGDMDSVSSEFSDDVKLIRFDRDKDFSDTELCIKYLIDKGVKNIFLIGGGGGRSDHFLSIFSLLEKYRVLKKWFTANEVFIPIFEGDELVLDLDISTIVSIFSLSDKSVVSSDGLKWELDSFELDRLKHSLSNETNKDTISIKSLSGNSVALINF